MMPSKVRLVKVPIEQIFTRRKPNHQDRHYNVFIDGVDAGYVAAHSRESWRQTHTGVRYGFRGLYRLWRARCADGTERDYFGQRVDAVKFIVDHYTHVPVASSASAKQRTI